MILQRIAVDKLSVAAVARDLGISWNIVNTVAVESARALVYGGGHLDGVRHVGVDEPKANTVADKASRDASRQMNLPSSSATFRVLTRRLRQSTQSACICVHQHCYRKLGTSPA